MLTGRDSYIWSLCFEKILRGFFVEFSVSAGFLLLKALSCFNRFSLFSPPCPLCVGRAFDFFRSSTSSLFICLTQRLCCSAGRWVFSSQLILLSDTAQMFSIRVFLLHWPRERKKPELPVSLLSPLPTVSQLQGWPGSLPFQEMNCNSFHSLKNPP